MNFKLNEVRRSGKHSQLKPISKEELSLMNLQKHNKLLRRKEEENLNKFEEEDGIEDEVEARAEEEAKRKIAAEAELDKQ